MKKIEKIRARYNKITQAQDSFGRRVLCVLLTGVITAAGSIGILIAFGFAPSELFFLFCMAGSIATMCLAAGLSSPVRAVVWGVCGALWVLIEFFGLILGLILAPLAFLS